MLIDAKSSLAISLSISLMLASCRNSLSVSKDTLAAGAYDIAAENLASRAADGSWELQNPPDPPFRGAFDGTLLGKKGDELSLDKLRIDYNAKSGSFNYTYTLSAKDYPNEAHNLEDSYNIFNVRVSGNRNTFDQKRFIYLPRGAAGLAYATVVGTLICGMSVIGTPYNLYQAIKTTVDLNQTMSRYVNESKQLSTKDQLAEQLKSLSSIKRAITSIVQSNSKAAYLQTVIDRKISHTIFRQYMMDRLKTLQPTTVPLAFDSSANSTSAVSLLNVNPIDAEHLDKDGSTFLLIKLPGEVYKVALYPGLSLGITYVAATSTPLTWTFKNTFTQTELVGPKTAGCLASCFSSGQKVWQTANQHNFNQALATVRGVLLGMPATSKAGNPNEYAGYRQVLSFLDLVSAHNGELLAQIDPRIPTPKTWVIDQQAYQEDVDERMAPRLDPLTVSNESIFAAEQAAEASATVEEEPAADASSPVADAPDASPTDDSDSRQVESPGDGSRSGSEARGR